MPFPEKTLLSRAARRCFMVSLILSFFVICPIILLYTTGYRIDWKKFKLIPTGVLSIDVLPKNAQVVLNGAVQKSAMPVELFNRAPGIYTVSISAPGYKSWEKKIEINSQETTYIRNLTLFKESLPILIKEKKDNLSAQTFFAPNSPYAIYSETNLETNIFFADLVAQKYNPIATTTASSTLNISWSPDSKQYLIQIKESNKERFITGSISEPKPNHELSITPPKTFTYQWINNVLGGTGLLVGDPAPLYNLNNAVKRNVSNPPTSSLWFARNDGSFSIYNEPNKTITNPDATITQLADKPVKIINNTNDAVIIAYPDKITLINKFKDGTQKMVNLPGPYIENSQINNEWIAWSPWEITGIYKDGNSQLLFRTDEMMKAVLPLDEFGILLIATNNKILAFNPGYYITHELVNNAKIESVGVDAKEKIIYFYGKVGEKTGLYSLAY